MDSNIYRSFKLFDEDGNEQNIGVPFDEINWEENFSDFCYGDPLDKKPAVTEKFIKKFPNFLDLFIHYSPIYYN